MDNFCVTKCPIEVTMHHLGIFKQILFVVKIRRFIIAAVTDLKEFQPFEQWPFAINTFLTLMKSLCLKRWNSLGSVTAVINLLTFYPIHHCLSSILFLTRLLCWILGLGAICCCFADLNEQLHFVKINCS